MSGSDSIYNDTIDWNTPGPYGLNFTRTLTCYPEPTIPSLGSIEKIFSAFRGVVSILHFTSRLSGFDNLISSTVG
jgi:hypothetical protein